MIIEAPPSPAPVDDFAALPRIRPFTDFELDPIEDEPAYTGRRRAADIEANSGRHAQGTDEPVRRRRRADENGHDENGHDENGHDLLARLLARES